MTWMTKELTLDLLAIGQDFLRRCAEAINNQPQQEISEISEISETSDNRHPADTVPETTQPEPAPTTQPEAAATTNEDLHSEAQTLLRTIVQAEGTDWVTGTLFPKYGVQSLNDVPANQLSDLVADAKAHKGD
ncbi:hypothetical protein CU043_02360 [Corynebacterium striatum]|nr:hypothetical protein [Corynebacterium striatum]